MASKAYEIAFKLGAKLDKSYGSVFEAAERVASRTVDKIIKTAAAIGGTVLSVNTIKDSVNKAISFESAMADVAKVVDGLKDGAGKTTEAYAVMSKQLLNMTAYLPMTAEELAQITAAAGQAGIASTDLTKFTETAAKMGIAFDVTAEQAGQWMAQWRTSFRMSQEEVTALSDQINYLSNTSSEGATKLSEVVSRIGSLAEISGLSAAEVAAIGASMTGVTAEISATGIKNLMKAMNAGSAATDKQANILKKLGFSATNMAKRMQTDAQVAILDLLEAFKKLPEAEQSAALTQYFGSESVAAIAPLLSNLENLKDQFNKVGDASLYAGSMESEFASRAATTENKIQLAKNALDRLQITLGNLALPIVAEGAVLFGDAISKTVDGLPKTTKKAEILLNKFFGVIKNSWKTVEPFFTWIKKNPKVTANFFIAIGAAIASYKIVEGVKGLASGFQLLKTVLVTNPITLILAAVAAAIAIIAVNVAETNRKLRKENLAAHFGEISLSMSELEDVARRIVRTNNLDKLGEALNAFSDMESIQSSMSEAIEELNKLNWKVSIGLVLSESEKERYKENVTSFISDAQELLLQKQYAISLSLDVLTRDDENGAAIRDSVNSFYQNNYEELTRLGTQLQDAVNSAFEDGLLDIDEINAMNELQRKMAAITDAIAKSQFDAKLEVMGMGFDGTALTGEAFKELQLQINEEVLAAQGKYKEALTLNIANASVMLDQGAIDSRQYNLMVEEFKHNYLEDLGEIELKAASFQYDTIIKAYEKDFQAVIPKFSQVFDDSVSQLVSEVNSTGNWGIAADSFVRALAASNGLDKVSKENIKNLYKNLMPTYNELRKLAAFYEEAGKEIPAALSKGILDISTLGALTGDGDAMFALLGSALSGGNAEYAATLTKLQEMGAYIPEQLIEGVKLQNTELERCAYDMADSFLYSAEKRLSKGINANIPLNLSLSSAKTGMSATVEHVLNLQENSNIQKYATGCDYTPDTFIAGEKGPELITNAKGSKVFTAAETGNIFRNLSNQPNTPDYFLRYDNLFTNDPSRVDASEQTGEMRKLQTSYVSNETPISIELKNNFTMNGNSNETDLERFINEAFTKLMPQIKQAATQAVDEERRRQKIREERTSYA